jgi:hypothetical protein
MYVSELLIERGIIWSEFILFRCLFLGQEDLAGIAKKEGMIVSESEESESSEAESATSEEERLHHEIAQKLLRYFTHNDDNNYYLFVECGVTREIHVKPVFEYTWLELSVKIPKPPDELFHFVGIKRATDVTIEDTEELIYCSLQEN